ncbi:MAG: bifunctional riboflavin kinase/FMN adenylyltransferase [Bryobacteraceae bacterium]|nr:bifunctional riboflavin kinase/FMN adenylyltransferase [Bryobacteraceae bacterium]
MRIFRSLEEARASFAPSAVTIGNFDGVHAAHHELMRTVVGLARECGARPSALTFSPHPAEVVAPERAPLLLSSPAERCALMERDGVEQALILPFDEHVSSLDPEAFFREILVDTLGARAVVVGENFLFGRKQRGDVRTLRALGERYGVRIGIVPAVKWRGVLVSSSEIRRLLAVGDVSRAARLLGRPFAIAGRVVAGEGRGRRETVPTLNLEIPSLTLDRAAVPAKGVYITGTFEDGDGPLRSQTEPLDSGEVGDSPLCPQRDRVGSPLQQQRDRQDCPRRRSWRSVTNVGYRPTFGGQHLTIETFLLDPLEGDAPGRIRVEFLRRIRDERAFPSAEALRARIMQDVARAQAFFRRTERIGLR